MKPIPQCQYVIRKGEEPHPGRANILPWSPALALRPDEYERFDGELPKLTEKQLASGKKKELSQEQMNDSVRRLSILNAMDHLQSNEFTAQGLPKLDALKKLTGFDVTASERDKAWERHSAKGK